MGTLEKSSLSSLPTVFMRRLQLPKVGRGIRQVWPRRRCALGDADTVVKPNRHCLIRPLTIALLMSAACGGGTPAAPAAAPTVTTPSAPTAVNTWSVAGRLVDTASQQPIAGAQIAPTWDLASVTTRGDGSYELGALANPPTTPYKLTVSGTGLLSREVWVTWQRGPRTDVTLDALSTAAPFS